MTEPSEQLDEILDAFLAHRRGDGPRPDLTRFSPEIRREAEARLSLLGAAHATLIGASSSGAERIAARFGLDRPGEQIDIAGAKVKRIRMSHKRDLAEIAGAVQEAGVVLSSAQLFRIETSAVSPVAQPIVTALVAVLDCSVADLEAMDSTDLSPVRAFINSPEFHELIKSWVADRGGDAESVARRAGDQLLAAHYRAEDVTIEHFRDILRAILWKLDA